MPIPVPETEYVRQYGELPDQEEQADIRAAWDRTYASTFEEEWRDYWTTGWDEPVPVDSLEKLYLFWNVVRGNLRYSGVEWTQTRANS